MATAVSVPLVPNFPPVDPATADPIDADFIGAGDRSMPMYDQPVS